MFVEHTRVMPDYIAVRPSEISKLLDMPARKSNQEDIYRKVRFVKALLTLIKIKKKNHQKSVNRKKPTYPVEISDKEKKERVSNSQKSSSRSCKGVTSN